MQETLWSNWSTFLQPEATDDMLTLENDILKVEVGETGAELRSIFHKLNGLQYLWDGNPQFWNRRAPLLFPIVGRLKNDTMSYQGQNYHMTQHGFVRDMLFEIMASTTQEITLKCESNSETKMKYPFVWVLYNKYSVNNNILSVESEVVNNSNSEPMLFSIGYHPAFRVPLVENLSYEDYELTLNHVPSSLQRHLIKDGLIDNFTESCLKGGLLSLSADTFANDAMVFKNIDTDEIILSSQRSPHGIRFMYKGFPYLGIWSKPNAHFVCLEPWHGIADRVSHDGNFENKEGIIQLASGETFRCGYQVALY